MFTSNLSADWGEALTNATGKANVFAQTLYDLQQAGDLQPILGAAASAANVLAIGLAWVGENLNWLIPLTGTAAAGLLTYTAVTKGFAIAEKAATVINTAFGTSLAITTPAMLPLILATLAGAAALLVLTGAFDKASNAMDNFVGNKIEDLRNIAGVELGKTELPVSIANTEPIRVRGEVQIEDQSIKYIYDLAEARRMREYQRRHRQCQQPVWGHPPGCRSPTTSWMSWCTAPRTSWLGLLWGWCKRDTAFFWTASICR